ncbi:SulP family inorganic anion transporter [Maribacter sp. 4G9]|uniref:SulP family inorganic anion transporter n=1 Tax=Maribacter sp. 4G9 TaxID=1889777 RepID=UPI000C154708|nr:sulfate permease [Maribacter sp. 4G9]PIB28141.1 sodium-independent anion transporter [Maribacter sp. 4G9]
MKRFLPFLAWAATYKKAYVTKDLIAGLTVGIVLVPQGMAYAMIAGLPPVYGLYTALVPVLTYVFLGTSRKVAMGPVAMDSLLVAAALGTFAISDISEYIGLAVVLVLIAGATQLLIGIFRMGFLVNFLSKPVISGFTSAAAIIIMISQLKHLLGISVPNSNHFHEIATMTLQKIGETNPYDLGLGVLGILIILGFKKWKRSFPAVLLVVVLGILAVYYFGLGDYGLELVGEVSKGLPSFSLPKITFENFKMLWPMGVALALVGYLETISIGKAMEDKSGEETMDANQELVALGASNMLGSFFQGYASTASFSRSAINQESGAKTNLAGLFSVILVVLTLLFFTPVFQYLPNTVLASIIMVSVFGLIDLEYAKYLWEDRKDEFAVLLVTFLVTLFIGITHGIVVGVLLSLLLMVYRTSKPHFAELGNLKGSDYYKNINRFNDEVIIRKDLLIVRFDSQLYFGNSGYFKKKMLKQIKSKGSDLKAVILNAEAMTYIDATGADVLSKLIHEIHDMGLQFYIAGAIGPMRDIIFTTNIINELQKEYLFVTTKEAVDYFDNVSQLSQLGARVAHENKRTR